MCVLKLQAKLGGELEKLTVSLKGLLACMTGDLSKQDPSLRLHTAKTALLSFIGGPEIKAY